jgi:L,D-peptidoglycan transpeptidase YkuD (ErfK/YbiS/YcfS/YnhG family)
MTEPESSKLLLSRCLRSFLVFAKTKLQGIEGLSALLPCGCIPMVAILLWGCSGIQAKPSFKEAHDLFDQGNYGAALNKYAQVIRDHPARGDTALFEMGIIYSHPRNERKDPEKALECFERLLKEYAGSADRKDAQMMVFYIQSVAAKDGAIAARDRTIAAQKTTIETLTRQHESKGSEIEALQRQVKDLENKAFAWATQKRSVDRILIQKTDRRLMLLSEGEVLKTYKIALGGNPHGPKERQGDNKTPEGVYSIASRNNDSRYHMALRISYPNERDRKRAQSLGVSPGGDIMIHGVKNGFSSVRDAHAEADWTKGCIAVTNEEIEEIARVVPNGTTVEIRP